MKYSIFFLLCCCLSSSFSYTQTWDAIKHNQHVNYTEVANSKPFNQPSWDALVSDVQISFADVNKRYDKKNAAAINIPQQSWNAIAWKGERVHTQFIIATKNAALKSIF